MWVLNWLRQKLAGKIFSAAENFNPGQIRPVQLSKMQTDFTIEFAQGERQR